MQTSAKRKRKREPSPTYFDPRQLDLVDLIQSDQARRRAFENLDRVIERTLTEAKTS
jgi:hypothetical protein